MSNLGQHLEGLFGNGLVQDWTMGKIASLAMLAIILIPINRLIYNAFFHPLASLPGPFIFRASVLPWKFYQFRGSTAWKLVELHDKYGPIVRIQPNEVSAIGPAAFKEILGHRVGKGGPLRRNNPGSMTDVDLFGGHSLMMTDIPNHARIRQRLNPAFSDKAVREQESLMQRYSDSLMKQLRKDPERPVDIAAYLSWLTFDVQGELVFGSNVFQCLEKERSHPWLDITTGFFEIIAMMDVMATVVPGFFTILPLLMKLLPREIASGPDEHIRRTKQMVDERLAIGDTEHPDYISFVLRENRDGEVLTKGEIYATSQQLVIGGSDTVSTAIAAALYYILSSPDKLALLKEEIRGSFDSADDITPTKTSEMEYLQAVLNEALRVFHPVPLAFARKVGAGGITVDGYFLPENTVVGVNNLPNGRYKHYYKDADKFLPERWLGDERYDNDNRDVFRPFGAGPLGCIGMTLGRTQLRMVLASLIWNFDMELLPQSSNWVQNQVSYVLWKKPPLMVKVTPR